ncbi:MAG: DUF992 domain-containing protein [Hyphomicrobiaceae bacterium]
MLKHAQAPIALGLFMIMTLGGAGNAAAQTRVEVGVLNCTVSGGAGFVIGSSKRLECTFKASNGRREPYFGRVNKFGLDVGATTQGVMAWGVFAPTIDTMAPGALAGDYAGISGEATLGVGLSANALVGGSGRTIALQPLSVGAQEGLNVALGITALTLESGR